MDIGELVLTPIQMANPDAYDEKYAKWIWLIYHYYDDYKYSSKRQPRSSLTSLKADEW